MVGDSGMNDSLSPTGQAAESEVDPIVALRYE